MHHYNYWLTNILSNTLKNITICICNNAQILQYIVILVAKCLPKPLIHNFLFI